MFGLGKNGILKGLGLGFLASTPFRVFMLGAAVGVVGARLLKGSGAKSLMASGAALAIRAKSSLDETFRGVQEGIGDVLIEASEINARKAAEKA